ncbi:hypothetical protein SEA_REYNAULD_17 [Rhodococcus phage Reynauld]|uniref:Uncharacterized protein n=1 Tax=Rhodococcus phage Reynauld TaxID=3062845 RepID=A0ACD4UKS7_9CAUD|nr:hypothetical protein SEA_REYNAULD_17 [Rhodococcus phage Reynauld]
MAMYGVNENGHPYVHQKIYKQRRIYGESIVTSGTVELCCRECLRWTVIRITTGGEFITAPSSGEGADNPAPLSLFPDSPGK